MTSKDREDIDSALGELRYQVALMPKPIKVAVLNDLKALARKYNDSGTADSNGAAIIVDNLHTLLRRLPTL